MTEFGSTPGGDRDRGAPAGPREARARAIARGFELRLRLCGSDAQEPPAQAAPSAAAGIMTGAAEASATPPPGSARQPGIMGQPEIPGRPGITGQPGFAHQPGVPGYPTVPGPAAPEALPPAAGPGISALAPPSPGLARGTLIATRRGPVAVEALRPGDRVLTLDDGLCAVTWVGHWRSPGLAARAPVRIAAGVLGNDRPLVLAPGHRVLVRPGAGPLAEQEVLLAAAALAGLPGITRLPEARSDWFAPVLAQHAVIFAENARIESLLPLPRALAALHPADRATLDAQASESPALVLPARPIVPEARAPRLILRHGLTLGAPQPATDEDPAGHGPRAENGAHRRPGLDPRRA